MKECCYKSVFGGYLVRHGRCNYTCLWCDSDVSMLWAFYSLSEVEKSEENKNIKHNLELLSKMGINPPEKHENNA